MLKSVQMDDLFPGYVNTNSDIEKTLLSLKAELQSISQERVVNQVFSKEVINDAKRVSSYLPIHLRSTKHPPNRNLNTPNNSQRPVQKLAINTINEPISIPDYVPPDNRPAKATNKFSPSYAVRQVGTSLMVPSMRQGSLPEKIRNIQTTPGMKPVFFPANSSSLHRFQY